MEVMKGCVPIKSPDAFFQKGTDNVYGNAVPKRLTTKTIESRLQVKGFQFGIEPVIST
jgi:hypothetical protein